MKYYVLVIYGGVDGYFKGPFESGTDRDAVARKIVQSSDFRADYDSIFRSDIENNTPEIYSFSDDELYAADL